VAGGDRVAQFLQRYAFGIQPLEQLESGLAPVALEVVE
jgi:hypothetical protein